MKFRFKSFLLFLLIILSVAFLVFDKDDPSTQKEESAQFTMGPQWDLLMVNKRNVSSAKQVFYNMVPRCGSKPMRYLLNSLSQVNRYTVSKDFTETYIIANYHISKESIRTTAHGLLSLNEPWLFTKHLNYINFTKEGYNLDPVYINIVRDPIDKLESHYYLRRTANLSENIITYWGKVVADFFKDADKADAQRRHNMTFDECVLTFDPECTDVRFIWTIIPHFCGQHYLCQTPTRHALNLAIKNVLTDFAVVGHVEKFVQFLEVAEVLLPQFFKGAVEMDKYLDHKIPAYRHKREFDGPKTSVEAKEVLMKNNAIKLEYEFYDFIRKRFKVIYESSTERKLS